MGDIAADRANAAGFDQLARLGLVAVTESARDDVAALALLPIANDAHCAARGFFARAVPVPTAAILGCGPGRRSIAAFALEKILSRVAGYMSRPGSSRGGRTMGRAARTTEKGSGGLPGLISGDYRKGHIMTRNLLTIAATGLIALGGLLTAGSGEAQAAGGHSGRAVHPARSHDGDVRHHSRHKANRHHRPRAHAHGRHEKPAVVDRHKPDRRATHLHHKHGRRHRGDHPARAAADRLPS
jgi:hypothetical protein